MLVSIQTGKNPTSLARLLRVLLVSMLFDLLVV